MKKVNMAILILGIIIFVLLTMFLIVLANIKLELKELHISNLEKKLKLDFVLDSVKK